MRRSPVRRSSTPISAPSGAPTRLPRAAGAAAIALLCAALLGGCGQASQAAGEPRGSFQVKVYRASFPRQQQIASPITLTIAVVNTGTETLPDIAVSVDSLTYQAKRPKGLADAERPVWVIDRGPGPVNEPPVESEEVSPPGGGETAFVRTWALGALAPHKRKVFTWRLTPVVSHSHTIHWRVSAGVYGKARAVAAAGEGTPQGSFTVHIAPQPRRTHVDPETGAVVKGPAPAVEGPVGVVP